MLRQFCKNGHPGGQLTWITLPRMAQLVWYIWCKVAKKISQFAPRTNLSTVVGDAENEGGAKKKQRSTTWQHCAAFLLSCGVISTPRNQIHDGSRDWMFAARVWDWSWLIYHGGVFKSMLLLPKSLVELLVIMVSCSQKNPGTQRRKLFGSSMITWKSQWQRKGGWLRRVCLDSQGRKT